jgi:hypothetical protein
METNQARLALRPQLNLAPASAPAEKFQNDTLRPVMKLQHEHIVAVFAQFLTKRKVKLDQLPAKQRWDKIKELVTRDNRLRGLLFGIAIGQFTTDEMTHYLENEGDANRRMTNLLTERLLSVYG